MPQVVVCFGTRPELIKLKPVLDRWGAVCADMPVLLLHTGQHTDLVNEALARWNHHPLERVHWIRDGEREQRLATMTDRVLAIMAKYPSLTHALVQGDTDSTLVGARAAHRAQLRLAHVEAGLRTHDITEPYPEEINRTTVAKLAHLHFAPTQQAAYNLLNEGIDAKQVLITGNTSMDALGVHQRRTPAGTAVRDLLVVTLHRNGGNPGAADALAEVVGELLAEHPQLRAYWTMHPNGIGRPAVWPAHASFAHGEALGHEAFLEMLQRAAVVVTDSGGVQEEATALGIPVVVYRKQHERPESMSTGTPALHTLDVQRIKSFVAQQKEHRPEPSTTFGDGKAAERIVDRLRVDVGVDRFHTVIIGGGPAGTGPLFAALKREGLDALLSHGLAIFERTDHLVAGALPDYAVNSDTSAGVFLECLSGAPGTAFDGASMNGLAQAISDQGSHSIPLQALRPYLHALGKRMETVVRAAPGCAVATGTTVSGVQRSPNGDWAIHVEGALRPTIARKVVLATGGTHKATLSHPTNTMAGKATVRSSDDLLRGACDELLAHSLPAAPHVCIIGSSHSGFSAAWYLLKHVHAKVMSAGRISIVGRTAPRIFFPSVADAEAAGYTDFTPNDVCPVTGRVYRLAGLRMDGRELYMRMCGLLAPVEKRVELIIADEERMTTAIRTADLVVDASGYRPTLIPVRDVDGMPIALQGEHNGRWVDQRCRVLDAAGTPVPGLYASGLATGFIPSGELGGEAGFTGQTNGLWYYQNIVGDILCHEITAPLR